MDIDIDLCPSAIPKILAEIKKRKHDDIIGNELDKTNLGIVRVATFGTETTKSAIHTAMRGYRSEYHPNGINSDEANYLASLIPQERGFVWSLNDVMNGNEEKGRKPVQAFISEVSKYPGLVDIIKALEGLITSRSTHASGVIIQSDDPYENGCFMRSPSGAVCTQWDLHDVEDTGSTKFDFLITSTSDKMVEFMKLMVKKGLWEQDSIRNLYNKYLHPDVIPYENKKIWENLANGSVIDCFQFCTPLGLTSVKKCYHKSVLETADLTSIMRLIIQEGKENPVDRYCRMKNDISLWYKELEEYGLNEIEVKKLEPLFLPSWGNVCQQEHLMLLFMKLCQFSLAESNKGRKVVSKKQMDKIPQLKKDVFNGMSNERPQFQKYVWEHGVEPLLGYGFPAAHAVPYSIIGIQNVWCFILSEVCWNTACLIVNSSSLEGEEDVYETNNPYLITVNQSQRSSKYDKIGSAIKQMQVSGVKVDCVDINKSDYSFEPDLKTNSILYGLKPLCGINDKEIELIKQNRPFRSFNDFVSKLVKDYDKENELKNEQKRKGTTGKRQQEIIKELCQIKSNSLSKGAVFSLIKAGSFDKIDERNRIELIVDFCNIITQKKKTVDMRTIPFLVKNSLIDRNKFDHEIRCWYFKEYLNGHKKKLKIDEKESVYFELDNNSYRFYEDNFDTDLLEVVNGKFYILEKTKKGFEPQYKEAIKLLQDELKKPETLEKVNKTLLKQTIIKEMNGKYDPSAWELETMCFYHGEHELSKLNKVKYGIVDFEDLEDKEIDSYFTPKGKNHPVPLYKISTIIGTVIGKNPNRATVTLNTVKGVVDVKFTKEFFSIFNKRISKQISADKKEYIENSWFERGSIIMVSGYRDQDMFRCKTYKNSGVHRIYKVTKIDKNKEDIYFTDRRAE